jgi:hypothetical protein
MDGGRSGGVGTDWLRGCFEMAGESTVEEVLYLLQ